MREFVDCVYWGVFFENTFPIPAKLENEVQNKHVTFGFKTKCPEDLIGLTCWVNVVGYGNDGRNEAALVEFDSVRDKRLLEAYNGADAMHVTISVADGAKPVDSANLDFHDIPFHYLEFGHVGYMDFDGEIRYYVPAREKHTV